MPVQFKDYYETLGVAKTASEDEIRKAFRKLARVHHPDVAKDKKNAESKFKEINEAYEVLSDGEKRKKYDTLGADWDRAGPAQPPPGWGQPGRPGGVRGNGGDQEFHFGGTGFSDFFEAFFGSGGGIPGMGGRAGVAQKGSDVEADIMVTLEEVLNGSKRKISFRRSDHAETETYEVRIPPGVREGQRIRLAGQGEAGPRGGGAGDLFLRVKLARHPDFRVEGGDLVHELDLAPWHAVLGYETQVPTLEGKARLKIPAGTQNHQRFRLRGLGLRKEDHTRGDLYVMVDIELPKQLSAAERDLWQQLAKVSADPAR